MRGNPGDMTYNVFGGTLNLALSIYLSICHVLRKYAVIGCNSLQHVCSMAYFYAFTEMLQHAERVLLQRFILFYCTPSAQCCNCLLQHLINFILHVQMV